MFFRKVVESVITKCYMIPCNKGQSGGLGYLRSADQATIMSCMFIKNLIGPAVRALAFMVVFAAGASMTAAEPVAWIELDGALVHPTHILAQYKNQAAPQTAKAAQLLRNVGLQSHRNFSLVPGLVLLDSRSGNQNGQIALRGQGKEPDPAALLKARIQVLQDSGQFDYVQPDYIYQKTLEPNDLRFQSGTLWGLKNDGQDGGTRGADISATQAWDLSTGSRDVVVAVLDSGIRYTHEDLASQMWMNPGELPDNGIDDDEDGFVDNVFGINALAIVTAPPPELPVNPTGEPPGEEPPGEEPPPDNSIPGEGDPFDFDGHGTHVAGILGAAANNGGLTVGVAWEVQMMAIKMLGPRGGPSSAAILGLEFALNEEVKISNNSWGGNRDDEALRNAIKAARAKNHLFIAASGNELEDSDQIPHFPSGYNLDNIISVMATDRKDARSISANFGERSVDLGAPGVAIYSTFTGSDNEYEVQTGTSMAAPHVAGAAVLLKSHFPEAGYTEIRDRIIGTADPIDSLQGKSVSGGRLNVFAALTASPDGTLEIVVEPPSTSTVLAGTQMAFFVLVTDLFGVTDASVIGQATGIEAPISFLNLGIEPDESPGDGIYSAYIDIPDVEIPAPEFIPDFVLTLTVTAPGKFESITDHTYSVLLPPPNDDFENASKILTNGESFLANNSLASIQTGEPAPAGVETFAASLWWNWSLANDTPVLIDTAGSAFDTVLTVYTGDSFSSLTEIVSVNDIGKKTAGYVNFDALAGVTYRITVAGVDEAATGTIRMRCEPNGLPDTTPPLIRITGPPSGLVVNDPEVTITGISSDPEPNASGVKQVIVLLNDSTFGSSAMGTTEWHSEVRLVPGINKIRAFAEDFANNSSAEISIEIIFVPDNAPNDLFAKSITLAEMSGSSEADSTSATKEFLEPNHASNEGGKSVWWTYSPPTDGKLTLDTASSELDTLLGVYVGDRITSLLILSSNDDVTRSDRTSSLAQAVRSGVEYRIAVDGFAGAGGLINLNYNLEEMQVFHLEVETQGEGGVNPASNDYEANTELSINAIPMPGYVFTEWEGDIPSTANPLPVVVDRDLSLKAIFEPEQFTDDFEGGNFNPNLPWVFDPLMSDQPWTVVVKSEDEEVADDPCKGGAVEFGRGAARSGVIGHSQKSGLVLRNMEVADGTGTFKYKVSSEENWDFFEFKIDGELVNRWSGELGWTAIEFPLSAGLHTLEWWYVKDSSGSAGCDAAFIDEINLPTIEPVPAVLEVDSFTEAGFRIKVQATPNVRHIVLGSDDLVEWTELFSIIPETDVFFYTDPDTLNFRFYQVVIP